MATRGASILAGSIILVGAIWLYVTQIQPRKVAEECAKSYVKVQGSVDMISLAIDICIKAGGPDAINQAIKARQTAAPAAAATPAK